MKKYVILGLTLLLTFGFAQVSMAQNYRQMVQDYVAANTSYGTFRISDPITGEQRQLQLVRAQSRLNSRGDKLPYVTANFRDTNSGESLTLDFFVKKDGDTTTISKAKIRKIGSASRYSYDSKGTIVLAEQPASAEPASSPMRGSGYRKGSY